MVDLARIGVFICECGSNISDKIDIKKVIGELSGMEQVVLVEPYRLMCSSEGKSYLEERIKKERLTHVVVAACSPREHQQTFMGVCETAGMNPYLMQLVNIREQCAWVTEDPQKATEKATRMIRAAIKRVAYQNSLPKRELEMNSDVLVLGGGIAGIEASLLLASRGRKVYLVEREAKLGGLAASFQRAYPNMTDLPLFLEGRIAQVMKDPHIEVMSESVLEHVVGFSGNFEVRLRRAGEGDVTKDIEVGAVILTTGGQLFDPHRIRGNGYGMVDNVITALEFESMNRAGPIRLKDGSTPSSVALIHCVGREVKGYCSGICCMYGMKFSRYLTESLPGIKVFHLYSDMTVPGKDNQNFMEDTLKGGPELVRVADPRVRQGERGPTIDYLDENGGTKGLSVDMIILLPALEPRADAVEVAKLVGIETDGEGFFAQQHQKLGPVSASKEGVYIAGCAQGPKDLHDSIAQAQATAGRVLASLVPGRKIEIEAKTSHILESFCQGCKSCISVCPFGAISFDEQRKVAVVNEVLCRGCGNCSAACPSGAAVLKHSTYGQIYQEIMEAVR